MIASYEIAEIIAKTSSEYSVEENVIRSALTSVISSVKHQDPSTILKVLPLSNDSIRRRIDEMAVDIEDQLITKLKNTKFSIQIDESTVTDNKALLMSYVRYFDSDCKCREEMLFTKF